MKKNTLLQFLKVIDAFRILDDTRENHSLINPIKAVVVKTFSGSSFSSTAIFNAISVCKEKNELPFLHLFYRMWFDWHLRGINDTDVKLLSSRKSLFSTFGRVTPLQHLMEAFLVPHMLLVKTPPILRVQILNSSKCDKCQALRKCRVRWSGMNLSGVHIS